MMVMEGLDSLVTEKFVAFREKIIDVFRDKHPHVFSVMNAVLAGRQNKIGMQVTEEGRVMGEYTFRLEGVRVASADGGKLESEIHHPFLGLIKPYVVVERRTLEKILGDEAEFKKDLSGAIAKYLPELTIKFLH